jgi:hypothetical protein
MTQVHRAVILLGLLLAAFGALLGAQSSLPVAAASFVIAGALFVIVGLVLRRRQRAGRPRPAEAPAPAEPDVRREPDVLPVVLPAVALDTAPVAPAATSTATSAVGAASIPVPARLSKEDRERQERQAIREAELARDAELDAIADGLRSLRSRDLSSTHIPEWKARIETWIVADLEARLERGEEVTPQAAEWMRDFGEIPIKDWRRHMLRHLRRLGYRKYQEGEW